MVRPVSPDADLRNADWLRRTWPQEAETLPGFLAYFGLKDLPVVDQRKEALRITRLPIFDAAPDSLRRILKDAGLIA